MPHVTLEKNSSIIIIIIMTIIGHRLYQSSESDLKVPQAFPVASVSAKIVNKFEGL
jgi:hypothetical protein